MTAVPAAALSPVRQIPAHELVVDQMRRALELGQFRPGDRLPTERELRREMRRNKRAIRDAFDYRIIVETGATRLAADRRRSVDLTALHKLLSGMDAALDTALTDQSAQHTTEFQTLDTAFHMGIAQCAQNDRLLDAVADARRRMWLPVGAIFGRLEPNANDYHESILEAIENREPELAALRMEEHINDTRHTIEAWLRR
jgi:GntR family transcriptional repressor for pyruvate dehydrogenase complex